MGSKKKTQSKMTFSMFQGVATLLIGVATLLVVGFCYLYVCKRTESGLRSVTTPRQDFAKYKLPMAHFPKYFQIRQHPGPYGYGEPMFERNLRLERMLEIEYGPSRSNWSHQITGGAAREQLAELDAPPLVEFTAKMNEVKPWYPQGIFSTHLGGQTTTWYNLCDGKGGLNDNGTLEPFDPEETERDHRNAKDFFRNRLGTKMVCPFCAGSRRITFTQPCKLCRGHRHLDRNHEPVVDYDPNEPADHVRPCQVCNSVFCYSVDAERAE